MWTFSIYPGTWKLSFKPLDLEATFVLEDDGFLLEFVSMARGDAKGRHMSRNLEESSTKMVEGRQTD